MTKEELKQEAEKWLRKFLLCNDCKRKCHCIELNAYCEEQVLKAYIDSAEPREKQIEILSKRILEIQADKGRLTDMVKELEAQIESMKRYLDCEYCEHYTQRSGCKNCNEEIRSDWKLKEIKEK